MVTRKKPVFAVPVDNTAIESNPLFRGDGQIQSDTRSHNAGVSREGRSVSEEHKERTRAGVARAKAEGKILGRRKNELRTEAGRLAGAYEAGYGPGFDS